MRKEQENRLQRGWASVLLKRAYKLKLKRKKELKKIEKKRKPRREERQKKNRKEKKRKKALIIGKC